MEIVLSYALQVTGTTDKAFLSGNGVPSSGLGAANDYYVDLDDGTLYQKLGTWTVVTNIKQMGKLTTQGSLSFGTAVPSNADQQNGDWYVRTTTGDVYYKHSGTWSIKLNVKGSTGSATSPNSYSAAASIFADPQPTTVKSALDRLGVRAKAQNGGTLIP